MNSDNRWTLITAYNNVWFWRTKFPQIVVMMSIEVLIGKGLMPFESGLAAIGIPWVLQSLVLHRGIDVALDPLVAHQYLLISLTLIIVKFLFALTWHFVCFYFNLHNYNFLYRQNIKRWSEALSRNIYGYMAWGNTAENKDEQHRSLEPSSTGQSLFFHSVYLVHWHLSPISQFSVLPSDSIPAYNRTTQPCEYGKWLLALVQKRGMNTSWYSTIEQITGCIILETIQKEQTVAKEPTWMRRVGDPYVGTIVLSNTMLVTLPVQLQLRKSITSGATENSVLLRMQFMLEKWYFHTVT